MTYYLVLGEEQDQVATYTGLADLRKFVESNPKTSKLSHLIERGWAKGLDDMEAETKVLTEEATGGVAETLRGIAALLSARLNSVDTAELTNGMASRETEEEWFVEEPTVSQMVDVLNYNPSQPRDEQGQWGSGGGGSSTAISPATKLDSSGSVSKYLKSKGLVGYGSGKISPGNLKKMEELNPKGISGGLKIPGDIASDPQAVSKLQTVLPADTKIHSKSQTYIASGEKFAAKPEKVSKELATKTTPMKPIEPKPNESAVLLAISKPQESAKPAAVPVKAAAKSAEKDAGGEKPKPRKLTQKQWEGSLNEEETKSLHRYIGDDYVKIRGCQNRGMGCTPSTQKDIANLKQIMDRAPKYTEPTYRGLAFDNPKQRATFVAQLQKNGAIDKGFTSTTKKWSVADNFSGTSATEAKSGLIMKIQGRSGVDLGGFNKNEAEVLMPPGARLKFLKMEKTSSGKLLVHVKEE